jgi:hypothetical protein
MARGRRRHNGILVVPVEGHGEERSFVDDIRDVDRPAVDVEEGRGLPRGTTGMFCALTKEGWIKLLIELRR